MTVKIHIVVMCSKCRNLEDQLKNALPGTFRVETPESLWLTGQVAAVGKPRDACKIWVETSLGNCLL
jgi:hypothetical protein